MVLRYIFALLACHFLLPLLSLSQDTIVVQTFTWDMNQRSGVFAFPDDPGQTWRKILMRYNMRCHDAAVGNGNVGCYEWDYSCNTFITDSSRVDSVRATHPSHVISNFSGTSFAYTSQPTFSYLAFEQYQTDYLNVLSETTATVGGNTGSLSLEKGEPVGKSQFLFTAAELQAAGLGAGPITGLRWHVTTPDLPLQYLRLGMKHTAKTELDPSSPDLDGFTEVYFLHTGFGPGENSLHFYQPFIWDGASNILLEYHFTNPPASNASNLLEADDAGFAAAISSSVPDKAIRFAGSGYVDVPSAVFDEVAGEVTISLWSFGTASALPANTSVFEGWDAGNLRQLNVHLPWSNGSIYWDCGNDGTGYDRIEKAANPADFEGKWNHWAFTKNAGTGQMRIYLNGQLWHSGTGKTRLIGDLHHFYIGLSGPLTNPYFGSVHEVQIWNKALDQATIQSWMSKPITPDHPHYSHLMANYPFDEGMGTTAFDAGPKDMDAAIEGFPAWHLLRGDKLYKNFESSSLRPKTTFVQGEYDQETTAIAVMDSVLNNLHSLTSYTVAGTNLVNLGTQYVYPAGPMPVLDESGTQVGSVYAAPENTVNISTLNYYAKSPAKYELLSLVTPYGNGLDLGQAGKTFYFDVSDYAPILRGNKRLSIEMGGENQEELDIQFWYITGTPEREVKDIQHIWPFRRGWYADIQNNNVFEPLSLTFRPDAEAFKLRCAVTGHGQNGEFVPRIHYIDIDGGIPEFFFEVWKQCGEIPIYPQGGTWLFDRAGWCPGDPTLVHELEITDLVDPGSTVTIDYGVEGNFLSEANYLVSNQLVSYGPYAHGLDASLEAIARPSKRVEFERINPACNKPIIHVKNAGSQYINSLTVDYWVNGNGTTLSHTYQGSITPGETKDIELPVPFVGFWKTEEAQIFYARITAVNGQADEYADNDLMESAFDLPLILDDQLDLILKIRTNNRASENWYTIRDHSGAIVASRYNMTNNTTYEDDINFPPGCYTLHLEDLGDDGLSYWFDPPAGSGYSRISQVINGFDLNIYSFESEFGGSIKFDFVIGEITSAEEVTETRIFSIFPNPASQSATIELSGMPGGSVDIELSDLMGRSLWRRTTEAQAGFFRQEIALQHLPAGIYLAKVTVGNKVWVKELVIGGW